MCTMNTNSTQSVKKSETDDHLLIANGKVGIKFSDKNKLGLKEFTDLDKGRNFISSVDAPLYTLLLSRKGSDLVELSSMDAEIVEIQQCSDDEGEHLILYFKGHGTYDISVVCKLLLVANTSTSKWRISVQNNTSYGIRCIRYPVVISPKILGVDDEDDRFVWGLWGGQMIRSPNKNLPAYEDFGYPFRQYPGGVSMQCQVYYDDEAGLYMATHDNTGALKDFGAQRIDEGIDLSIEHHPDEMPGLSFELPYETILSTFHGDWYTAADLYRAWATKQHWCSKKIVERDDIPNWVKEPRLWPCVICRGDYERLRGSVKSPPSEWPIPRFWPAKRIIPIMREYARIFDTPFVIWMEGFEKIGGPSGPVDIFPPYEGAESFKAAMNQLSQDGHIPFAFLGGFQWAITRPTVGYDGRERFEKEGKPLAVVNADGEVIEYRWVNQHKVNVSLCVGSEETQKLFLDNLMQLMDLDIIALQIDHQVGMHTPVCYSEEHDHPPGYGRWMYEQMRDFLRRARKAYQQRNPNATFSHETPCEMWIQEVDLQMHRPYLIRPFGQRAVPLFDYVYHDYALTYGGDFMLGLAHPNVELIKHARVFTYGLQNMLGIGQYEWDYEVNPNFPGFTLIRNIVSAQRTYARDYLVFGQMLKPTSIEVNNVGIDLYSHSSLGEGPPDLGKAEIPTVMHSVWKSQAGKIGYILANWTENIQNVTIELIKPGGQVALIGNEGRKKVLEGEVNSGKLSLSLEPCSVALIEQETT